MSNITNLALSNWNIRRKIICGTNWIITIIWVSHERMRISGLFKMFY